MAEDYFGQVAELTRSIDLLALQRVVSVLRDARERGACVFIFGNGGSAATASHMAADLTNAPRRAGQKPLRVLSLADNMACLSALANDEGYEHTFASQLDAHVRAGDVVVAISASGNSPNLLGAIELAKARGATTVGLVGFDGGDLRHLAEEVVFVASPIGAYGPVEDVHLMLGHIITTCLCNA